MGKFNWNKYLLWMIRIILLVLPLLLVLLVGSVFFFWFQIREMKNQLMYLQDTTNIIQMDVGSLQADIEKTLREENSILEDYSIDVVDTDFEAGTYEVSVTAVPKEYTDDTSMSIFFGTTEYALKRDGFTFSGSVDLPLENSYVGNVTFLIVNGEKRNTEVMRDYAGFQEQFDHIVSGEMENVPEYHNGNLSVKGNVDFQLSGEESYGVLAFSSLKLIVMAGQEELYQEELITETADGGQGAKIALPRQESVTDEAGMETESGSVIAQTVTGLYGNHYLNLKAEVEPGSEVRIFLQAVSLDGYTFEYEIFKGTTVESGDGFVEEDGFTGEYSVYDRKGGLYTPKNE